MKLLIWSFSQVEAESSNFGDRAIFRSLVTDIYEAFPGIEISSLSSDPFVTRQIYGVNAIGFKEISKILSAIRKSDLVVLGGGEFIQDRTSLLYLIANLSIGAVAIALRRPIAFLAIGVADEDEISSVGRLIARLILNKAQFITVRDTQSKAVLERIKVTGPPIHVTADAASTLSIASEDRIDKIMELQDITKEHKPLIGVVPRRMIYGKFKLLPIGLQIRLKMLPPAYQSSNYRLARILADSLDNAVARLGAQILFIPMYEGQDFSYHDQDFASQIISLMNKKENARILSGTYAPEDLKGVFSRLDMVIGMTLHSMIVAATTHVPTIPVSYASKMDRFVQMLGQENYSLKIEELTVRELSERIYDVASNQKSIRDRLIPIADTLRERAISNMKVLSDCLFKIDGTK